MTGFDGVTGFDDVSAVIPVVAIQLACNVNTERKAFSAEKVADSHAKVCPAVIVVFGRAEPFDFTVCKEAFHAVAPAVPMQVNADVFQVFSCRNDCSVSHNDLSSVLS